MQDVDAFLLGRRTYVTHAEAFEPMPAGDPFGDLMNAPAKYVVSRTLEKPIWRNTTIIRDDAVEAVRALKAQPGKDIITDGSSQLVHTLLAARSRRRAAPRLSRSPSAAGSGFSPRACTGRSACSRPSHTPPASSACTTPVRRADTILRRATPSPTRALYPQLYHPYE